MLKNKAILALFKDAEDETLHSRLLAGIPGIIRAVTVKDLVLTLENMKRIGIEPCLTIFTARLYPRERPNLVSTIRGVFPRTEFLLISSAADPFPSLQPLAADRIRHLAINPAVSPDDSSREVNDQFFTAVTKLVEGQPWEIADYVMPGTPIHEFAVASSTEKEELIACVENAIRGNLPGIDFLRQKGALLADEMLENAMYGAPQGEDGGKLYRKGEHRPILPGEGIVFRFSFDGETFAMEVADCWGSLSADLILEYLAKNQEESARFDETGGRGLFIIWRFFDHFHVSIHPGKQTVVGGHIRASSPLDPEAPKGYHISTHM